MCVLINSDVDIKQDVSGGNWPLLLDSMASARPLYNSDGVCVCVCYARNIYTKLHIEWLQNIMTKRAPGRTSHNSVGQPARELNDLT